MLYAVYCVYKLYAGVQCVHVLYAAMSYLLSILYGLFRRKRMSANERGERPCERETTWQWHG